VHITSPTQLRIIPHKLINARKKYSKNQIFLQKKPRFIGAAFVLIGFSGEKQDLMFRENAAKKA
jgi:hypothetical protein